MATPPLMGHDELRKREADYVAGLTSTYGYISTGGYSAHSTEAFPTDSAGSYPTQSTGNIYSSTTNAVAGGPTPASQGISSSGNVTTLAATSAAVPQVSSSQVLGVSATTSGPLVYTGMGFHSSPSVTGTLLVAFAALYV